jgi:hypothetical protein
MDHEDHCQPNLKSGKPDAQSVFQPTSPRLAVLSQAQSHLTTEASPVAGASHGGI